MGDHLIEIMPIQASHHYDKGDDNLPLDLVLYTWECVLEKVGELGIVFDDRLEALKALDGAVFVAIDNYQGYSILEGPRGSKWSLLSNSMRALIKLSTPWSKVALDQDPGIEETLKHIVETAREFENNHKFKNVPTHIKESALSTILSLNDITGDNPYRFTERISMEKDPLMLDFFAKKIRLSAGIAAAITLKAEWGDTIENNTGSFEISNPSHHAHENVMAELRSMIEHLIEHSGFKMPNWAAELLPWGQPIWGLEDE